MTDKMTKPLLYLNIASAALHIFLGLIAGLQNCPIREFGIFFTILGIMALISVVGAAFVHPLMVIPSLIGIVVPGMIAAVLIRMVLMGTILMMFAAPAVGYLEIIKTIMAIYGI